MALVLRLDGEQLADVDALRASGVPVLVSVGDDGGPVPGDPAGDGPALAQVPPRLEEAARTLGDTPTRAFFRVTFPLLWRGAAAGGSLAFIGAMKELPITLLLAPTGFSTLATRAFGYTQEAMFAEAAPFALLIVGLSAAFVGVLLWNERRF